MEKKLYRYVLVQYNDIDSDESYWYKTDNYNIEKDDVVLVDRAGTYTEATVIEIDDFLKDDVPYPINKTKDVIKKIYNKEDINDEIKLDYYDDDIDEVIKENKELKSDIKIYEKIIDMATKNYLSISRLLKIAIQEKGKSDLYYNIKLNLFISKIGDSIYCLPEYSKIYLTKTILLKVLRESIEIHFYKFDNIEMLNSEAIELCKNNKINYIDDFNIKERKIGKTNLFKKLQNEKIENIPTVQERTYLDLKSYVRDMDLLENVIDLYRANIGEILQEKAYVDCTYKIGGMIKNTRFIILSNSINNLSLFETESNWGICVANRESNFKVLDVKTIKDKNVIILLHLDKKYSFLFKNKINDFEKDLIRECIEEFKSDIDKKHIKELDREWYQRLFFPIGIRYRK